MREDSFYYSNSEIETISTITFLSFESVFDRFKVDV